MTRIIIIIAVVSSIVVPAYSRFMSRAQFDAKVRHFLEVAHQEGNVVEAKLHLSPLFHAMPTNQMPRMPS